MSLHSTSKFKVLATIVKVLSSWQGCPTPALNPSFSLNISTLQVFISAKYYLAIVYEVAEGEIEPFWQNNNTNTPSSSFMCQSCKFYPWNNRHAVFKNLTQAHFHEYAIFIAEASIVVLGVYSLLGVGDQKHIF